MQTKSRCHHRYALSEESFFITEDGMEVFIAGGNFQKCNVCGHVDFPLEMKEMTDSHQKDRRLSPQYSKQKNMDLNLIDVL